MSYEEIFKPQISPCVFLKSDNDPSLADVRSSPDIDQSFLDAMADNSAVDWMQDDFLSCNGESVINPSLFYESRLFDDGSYLPYPLLGVSDQKSSAGAKQPLASTFSVDDEAGLPASSHQMVYQIPKEEPNQNFEERVVSFPRSSISETESSLDAEIQPVRKSVSLSNSIFKKVPSASSTAKQTKRGRPMKVTSHSKQALYAREYRRKNKLALWTYEKLVAEQSEEISDLLKQNKEMRDRLNVMTRQFAIMKRLISGYPSIAAKFEDMSDSFF